MNLMQIRDKHNNAISRVHRETDQQMVEHVRALVAELPIPATEVFYDKGHFYLKLIPSDGKPRCVDYITIRAWTMPYGARPAFSLEGCPSEVLEDLVLALEWWDVPGGMTFKVYPKVTA